jgi:O-antigen/teichoic acid export membrane protein
MQVSLSTPSISSNRLNIILKKIKSYLNVVKLTPFDTSTDVGRSKERYRRMALTSFVSALTKGIALLTSLISVPLTVKYLGPERYGMWMTASSVIALLGFADLGMGNGLINAISESDGKDDHKAAQMYVSSAFFMLLGISIVILFLFALVYPYIPWAHVFNVVSNQAISEAGPAMAIFIVSLAISMPFGVAQRVQMGYQEGFKAQLWGTVGSLLGFGGVLLVIYLKAGLPWLVLAMTGGPCFAMLLNWLEVFCLSRIWLFPRITALNGVASRKILRVGMAFLILQVMAIIGFSSDNLVIAQVYGSSTVANYAIVYKLFTVTMIAPYFVAPLWPAFGEALARRDYCWAKKTLNMALRLTFTSCAVTAGPLLIYGNLILKYWVSSVSTASTCLLAGFVVFVFLSGYIGVMSTYLNSGKLVAKQTIFFSVASLASLGLKILLAYKWQLAGVIWATDICFSLFYVYPVWKLAYGSLQKQS